MNSQTTSIILPSWVSYVVYIVSIWGIIDHIIMELYYIALYMMKYGFHCRSLL